MSSDTTPETPAGIADEIDPEETIELLQDIVRIPSPFFEETDIAAYIYDWLDQRGLDPEYHAVSEPAITGFEDGKLYGQSACDMKGGLASLLVTFEALSKHDLRGDVILTTVVDEKGPFGLGTDATIRDGLTDDCDPAVVTEPAPTITQQ